jgi:mono/diheme cytochrome c family protein
MKNTPAISMIGLALFCALTLTTAFAKPPPKKAPVTKADPAKGKKVYASNSCGGCHKIKDVGGEAGPALTAYASDKKKDAKWTAAQIQDPKKHNPDSKMPAYGDKIKGKDLDNLVAYLLTLKG